MTALIAWRFAQQQIAGLSVQVRAQTLHSSSRCISDGICTGIVITPRVEHQRAAGRGQQFQKGSERGLRHGSPMLRLRQAGQIAPPTAKVADVLRIGHRQLFTDKTADLTAVFQRHFAYAQGGRNASHKRTELIGRH